MAIVFFGTFDPFHENHFRLVEYVAKTYNPKKIAIIPNSDTKPKSSTTSPGTIASAATGSGFKSDALPLKIRLSMVQARLVVGEHQNPLSKERLWAGEHMGGLPREGEGALPHPQIEVIDPGLTITNWSGRQKLACQFGKRHGLPILYVVVGLDSLESSLRRSGDGYNPLEHFVLKLLVIPRLGYILPTIPEKYKDKIRIDLNYREQIQVSSTLIRQLIRSGLPVDPNICHPKIVDYLVANKCYQVPEIKIPEFTFIVETRQQQDMSIIVFMGSPGSGKSSLAEQLAKSSDYLLISTGEFYRTDKEHNTRHYQILEKHRSDPLVFREALSQYIFYKIHHAITESAKKKIVIEGFKAGDLTSLTKYGWNVELLIYVQVDRDQLESRVKDRNMTRKDESAFTHRVDTYYNIYMGEIDSEISTLRAKNSIKNMSSLDNNGTWEESLAKMFALVG